MDVQLVNPFIEATIHVLSSLAFVEAHVGRPYLKKDPVAQGDVSGIVGLSGEAKGTISVTFTKQCILKIVSKMFGEEITEINDEVRDAVGEILNIVSGNGRQRLRGLGKRVKGAIPTIITGRNHIITHITSHPIIAVPFETENGSFTFEVCLEE
ncbi:MAG TPA: chemotaxis protein CheX [Deltaproteobacteria bacterium]|nr:chemotaxis protein CheX [Methanoregulaceae archaeon]HQG32403.1 chemotaxis protein CheX [Deltaproteobacteria bacterium]